MRTNKQLLSKKEYIEKMISLPLITLEAEEADRFIDYIVDESVMKNSARVVKMKKETKNIRALGLGDARFLYPGATFSSSDYMKQLTDHAKSICDDNVKDCTKCPIKFACSPRFDDSFEIWADRMNAAAEEVR